MIKILLLFVTCPAILLGGIIGGPHIQFSADSIHSSYRMDYDCYTARVVVSWITSNPCLSKIEWGTTTGYGSATATATNTRYHHIEIPLNLADETKYYYRVTSTSPADTATGYFTSPDRTLEPQTNYRDFRFAVVGNTCTNPDTFQMVWNRLVADKPKFVIHTGDVVDDPAGGSVTDWLTEYFDIISSQSDTLPIFNILGDREYGENASVLRDSIFHHTQPYHGQQIYELDWFSNEQADSAWGDWWVFHYGPAMFVGWNSNVPMGYHGRPPSWPSQAQWSILSSQMALNPRPYTFIFIHDCPYSSGGEASSQAVRDTVFSLMEKFDCHAMFTGDRPYYQRSAITTSNIYLPTLNETIYIINTGGGGAPLTETPTSDSSYVQKSLARHHYLTVDVTDDSAKVRAIHGSDGTVLDSVLIYPNKFIGKPFLTFYGHADSTIRVNWRTIKPDTGIVRWGASSGAYMDSVLSDSTVKLHRIDITGLLPDTKYFYQVRSGLTYAREDTFTTSKAWDDNSEFQVLWTGDLQFTCQHNLTQAIQCIDSIVAIEEGRNKRKFSFWGQNGDWVGGWNMNRFYQYAESNRLMGPLAGHLALMDCRGNNDAFETEYKMTFAYNRAIENDNSYSFKWQNYRFIALDALDLGTLWGESYKYGTEKWDWINSQLDSAIAQNEPVVIYSHFSPWHPLREGAENFMSPMDTLDFHVGRLASAKGVCLWLWGDTHVNAWGQYDPMAGGTSTMAQQGNWERVRFNVGIVKQINFYRNFWAGKKDSLISTTTGFPAQTRGVPVSNVRSNFISD